MINWDHCIYLGLHDIISSYFAFSMSDSSDYYEEPSTDEEASAPGPSVSAAAPAQSSSASSAVSSGSASALSASVVPATSAASSSGSSSSEPVAGPNRPDTSVPVGSPVVSVPLPGRRPAGVLLPGELRDPGVETFMGIYNRGELGQLENWVEQSRRTRPYAGFMVGHPPISCSFASLLLQLYGRYWESRLLSMSGDVILFSLGAYIRGYSRLTSFQRGQFRRLWPAWNQAKRARQLQLLAEEGGLLVVE